MFRFSIRELLLLTLVAAVCGGWWADRQRRANVAEEWHSYATCLEKLLMSDGFEILRDRDWVRATRITPSPSVPGDRNTAYANPAPTPR